MKRVRKIKAKDGFGREYTYYEILDGHELQTGSDEPTGNTGEREPDDKEGSTGGDGIDGTIHSMPKLQRL